MVASRPHTPSRTRLIRLRGWLPPSDRRSGETLPTRLRRPIASAAGRPTRPVGKRLPDSTLPRSGSWRTPCAICSSRGSKTRRWRFRKPCAIRPLSGSAKEPVVTAEEDGVVFFVDGLRYDLGQRLVERLSERGLRAQIASRWAALPTVTATAKPAVSPAADAIEGTTLGAGLRPRLRRERPSGERPATPGRSGRGRLPDPGPRGIRRATRRGIAGMGRNRGD